MLNKLKQILFFSIVALTITIGPLALSSQNAYAEDQKTEATTSSEDKCNKRFLLFPPWYRGLTEGDNCEIKKISDQDGVPLQTFIWTVVLNISDGIFSAAGVVATGFIIWGGIQYMLSQGDMNGIQSAKITIRNAIIGLIITILAITLTNFILGVLK